MRIARATSARTAQSAPTRDFNLRSVNQPLEERYFERRQIREAIAFAEAGGIAIHRNFDYYHGSKIRGMTREKPFLHVIGLRTLLEEWGRHHGLRPEWIQPEKRRKVAHYDVFGPSAELLIARVSGTNPDKAP
jgi:hypothetical protein